MKIQIKKQSSSITNRWMGMDRTNGTRLTGDAHVWQSVYNIIFTPIGSRIQRRDFGSLLPELIDHPHNATNRLRLSACVVMAVKRWEPRLTINRAYITAPKMNGQTELVIEGRVNNNVVDLRYSPGNPTSDLKGAAHD